MSMGKILVFSNPHPVANYVTGSADREVILLTGVQKFRQPGRPGD